jgi:hypothetical protein
VDLGVGVGHNDPVTLVNAAFVSLSAPFLNASTIRSTKYLGAESRHLTGSSMNCASPPNSSPADFR